MMAILVVSVWAGQVTGEKAGAGDVQCGGGTEAPRLASIRTPCFISSSL